VRGLLWITGWLRVLDGEEARSAVLEVVEAKPDPRLLDAGHGATVLRLTPASMVVADAEGTSSVRPSEFGEAEPDPFCLHEDQWLRHLELSHRDVVELLSDTCRSTFAVVTSGPSAWTAWGCGCGSKPSRATTTCGSPSRTRSTRPRNCPASCVA